MVFIRHHFASWRLSRQNRSLQTQREARLGYRGCRSTIEALIHKRNYDVTHPRVDAGAQKALINMKRNPATNGVARAIITAIRNGRLRGVCGDDLPSSARLAGRRGIDSWELVPRGQVATVVCDGSSTAPSMIYRAHFRGHTDRLAAELAAAWRTSSGARSYNSESEAHSAFERSDSGEAEVLGNDDRRIVPDTLAIPFRFVCCIRMTFTHPTTGYPMVLRGSGTLISDRHVLTCAHNILEDVSRFNQHKGLTGTDAFPARPLWANRIFVAPALNGREMVANVAGVSQMHVARRWRAFADSVARGNRPGLAPSEDDFGLLTLDAPLGAMQLPETGMQLSPPPLGFWGHPRFGGGTRIRPIDPAKLRNQTVNIAGYPSDKCLDLPHIGSLSDEGALFCELRQPGNSIFDDQGSTQWVSTGQVISPSLPSSPRLLTHNTDMFSGQSGSPLWVRWLGFRNLVGINTSDFLSPSNPPRVTANQAVRITEELITEVRAWM
jgi:V8-like Glu-specific endopeptidase